MFYRSLMFRLNYCPVPVIDCSWLSVEDRSQVQKTINCSILSTVRIFSLFYFETWARMKIRPVLFPQIPLLKTVFEDISGSRPSATVNEVCRLAFCRTAVRALCSATRHNMLSKINCCSRQNNFPKGLNKEATVKEFTHK